MENPYLTNYSDRTVGEVRWRSAEVGLVNKVHWPPQVATPRFTGQGPLFGIFYPIIWEN